MKGNIVFFALMLVSLHLFAQKEKARYAPSPCLNEAVLLDSIPPYIVSKMDSIDCAKAKVNFLIKQGINFTQNNSKIVWDTKLTSLGCCLVYFEEAYDSTLKTLSLTVKFSSRQTLPKPFEVKFVNDRGDVVHLGKPYVVARFDVPEMEYSIVFKDVFTWHPNFSLIFQHSDNVDYRDEYGNLRIDKLIDE